MKIQWIWFLLYWQVQTQKKQRQVFTFHYFIKQTKVNPPHFTCGRNRSRESFRIKSTFSDHNLGSYSMVNFFSAILVQSCAGKFSGISIPARARKQLPDLENEAHLIGLLFYGSVSAVELSDFVTPGAAFSSFQNDAKADSDLLFNSRNLVFEWKFMVFNFACVCHFSMITVHDSKWVFMTFSF